jgi:steroid 5-alpha reductase family enzyme
MDTVFWIQIVFVDVLFMSLMWLWGRLKNNYGVIDVGWGLLSIVLSAVIFYNSPGSAVMKIFAFGFSLVWGGRLAYYLFTTRILSGHPEDKRYTAFRKDYGDAVHRKFFTNVFLLQGVLGFLLIPPFVFLSMDTSQDLGIFHFAGVVVFIVGILGETLADKQLHSFSKIAENKGKVCEIGLWKYTRHPNYFFEWVVWLGIGIASLGSPNGIYGMWSPLMMYILLVYVSGVPYAEKYSLLSRGEAFKDYQARVNAFFPWFPKKG